MALRKTGIAEEEQLQEECKDWDSFVKIDDHVVTSEVHSIEDIIKDIKSSKEPRPSEEAENDEDEEMDPPAVPSFASVMSVFSLLYTSLLNAGPLPKIFSTTSTKLHDKISPCIAPIQGKWLFSSS